MNTVQTSAFENPQPVPAVIPPLAVAESLSETERDALREEIKALLPQQDAVLVAHYYTDAELQRLAEETGGHVADSLEMAKFGHQHPAQTLVVAGVLFMGETAKILNPEKQVLMPDLQANCSLDIGCPAAQFSAFCDANPDRTVVVYANTSAAVKARADWVVTSGIALRVIQHLHDQGKKILWAPDRHLGAYVQNETGADMLLWQGSCIVHDAFQAQALQRLRQKHPEAAVLVHPESPAKVIAQADVVSSTTGLIQAARDRQEPTFIVATDRGIFYKMKQQAPGKKLLEAPNGGVGASCESCSHCPWMAMNGLRKLRDVLLHQDKEIFVAAQVRQRALIPLQRMLAFAKEEGVRLQGKGNA